ncbi:hypothetical protein SAMN05878276_0422 [Aquipseudomonas alcaligenes]|uniref:hypothetical protein n=1 Tax=Aquipseudomonas alcaligenes TaxID=43263 RepID=UPI0009551DA3|nr:hypothetical protein [Pseudomonas alcaligenes]SIR82691.1 hypothetical protein SAMN05878276_0422 [Pseudomonas alcaligenes]
MAEKKPLKKWAGGIGEMEPGDKVHSDFIDPWACLPIGVPVPVFTHITGVSAPPTDRSYRYIKLTASDSYNSGVLTSESVSGSAPLVLASAVVSLSGSPINGRTVQLINTERRALRAGSSGTLQDDALQGHWHDIYRATDGGRPRNSGGAVGPGANAALLNNTAAIDNNSYLARDIITDGTNGTPRTANETRAKNIGADYYMRIL